MSKNIISSDCPFKIKNGISWMIIYFLKNYSLNCTKYLLRMLKRKEQTNKKNRRGQKKTFDTFFKEKFNV
jgi:hypothetical protein